MIAQGTDGLSRGNHTTGVMQGMEMHTFLPLHQDPFFRSPSLKTWVSDIMADLSPEFLTPENWFGGLQKIGTFVWSPTPGAAEVVVERLGVAEHKQPQLLHVVLVLCLMTGRWRKHLSRGTNY